MNDMVKFYGKHIPKHKVVIHNGVKDVFKFQNLSRDDSVLFVGSRAKYKNFDLAVRIASKLRSKLVIVGSKLSEQEKIILDQFDVSHELHINAADNELCTLYNTVRVLIYCSEAEGFGIPILEAARCKCPSVVMNRDFAKEVIGEDALSVLKAKT